MNTRALRATLALLATLLAACPPAPCQWGSTPENPLPICTAEGEQHSIRLIRLGSGRYLITWGDPRTGATRNYYQLVDKFGVPLLENNGVKLVPNAAWSTGVDYLLPDNQGGCICVFYDARNGVEDIYGQRFDSLGNRLWGETGLPMILWSGMENVILKDAKTNAQGETFLSYGISQLFDTDIYMQKVNLDGDMLWGPTGVGIHVNPSINSAEDRLAPDEQGGVLDVWDRYFGEMPYLYTQRFDSSGQPFWGVNGISLQYPFGNPLTYYPLNMFPDGQNGGIFVGNTYGSGYDYAKILRVNGTTGSVPWYWIWGLGSTIFAAAVQHPVNLDVYCVRHVYSTPSYTCLHRFDQQGNNLFGHNGLMLENIGYGDLIVTTSDGVEVIGSNTQGRLLKAQRYDSTGQILWSAAGVILNFSPAGVSETVACSDGEDGLVAVWRDHAGSDDNLFAARMRADGQLGNPPLPPPYAPDYPQQQLFLRGNTVVFFMPNAGIVRLGLYDVLGRKVKELMQGQYPPGETYITLDLQDLTSGIYILRLNTNRGSAITKLVILQ